MNEATPKQRCGAKSKRTGEPCQTWPVKGKQRCRMHGGTRKGGGGPYGNQKRKSHGLFSKSLGEYGQEVYEGAAPLEAEALKRDAGNWAIAKIAEAWRGDNDVNGVLKLLTTHIEMLERSKQITPDAAAFMRRRIAEPDISALGKALAPVKGLLEKPSALLAADDDAAQGVLLVPAKSPEWRELMGESGT